MYKSGSKGRNGKARRKVLYENQRGRCYYCNCTMTLKQGFRTSATIEHCLPKSLGGTGNYFNIMLACYSCNQARGNGPAPKPHPYNRKTGVWSF